MTQEATTAPVGGANDAPVVAAEPTIEDRFAAIASGEGQDDPNKKPDDDHDDDGQAASVADGDDVTLTPDDVDDDGGDPAGDDLPAIAPPASWKAEEKEEFAKLPRALQETLTRRESERERFVQSKAQEAAQAKASVEREALGVIQQLQQAAAARFAEFEQHLAVSEPDPRLIAEDPELYAAQMMEFRQASAQRQQAQQLAAEAAQRAQLAQQQAAALEAQQTEAVLREQFPEYLDPSTGPKLREELGSTAIELGYSQEQLAAVDERDILAMRRAHEWRTKAAKYDKLMAQKMETVRAAKDLPKVSKPGVASAPGAVANQRYAQDRQLMKSGDKDAAARVFSEFI